ncbi:MAG: hypothetical protein JXR36_14045 [Bacteroidales bacterium]|nr:hypothetical protein [Bacteroidales bacterium]
MKNLLLFSALILAVIISSCSASVNQEKDDNSQKPNVISDLEKSSLKGEIKSIDERRYYYDYNADSILGKGDLETRHRTSYNDKGFVESVEYFGSENYLISKTVNFYGEDNLRDSSQIFKEEGKLDGYKKYFHNELGLLMTTENYLADGDMHTVEVITYDSNNNPTKLEMFIRGENEASVVTTKFFDENNKLIKSEFEDKSQGICTVVEYYYDDSGAFEKRIVTEHDSNIKDVYEYEYEYDDKGNWITKVEIRNGRKSFLIERQID